MSRNDNPLLVLIRRVDEARQRELDRLSPQCNAGPSLAALYLYVAEGVELPPTHLEHLKACPVCGRLLDSVEGHVDAARIGEDGTSEAPFGPEKATRLTRRRAAAGGARLQSALMPLVRHWRASLGGLAVAAAILLAVGILWTPTPTMADDALFRRIALRLVFLPVADPFLSDDPSALAPRLAEIDQFKAERDQLLRFAASSSHFEGRQKANHDAMQPWHGVYRRLRDIGRFDEAITEAQNLIAYIQADTDLRNPHGPLKSTFADVGNIYLAISDFANARQAYAASIAARQEYVRVTLLEPPDHPDNIGNPIQNVVPLYWSMSNLAIAERNLAEAREWIDHGDATFDAYFTGICRSNEIEVSAAADVVTLFRATPPVFQSPPERPTEEQLAAFAATYRGWKPNAVFVTKLRAHLYYKARLVLAEGETHEAQRILDAARDVAYFACADEDRLDFYEPLLVARIAIAERRYADAQRAIADAEQHAGLPPCSDLANNRPIASARIAELAMLKGVALFGVDEKSAAGAQLVEKALEVPMQLADGLPPGQRDAFLKQFELWRELADEVRRARP